MTMVAAGSCSISPIVTSTTTTTPARPPPPELTLTPNGIGPLSFGSNPEDVLAAVTEQFGAPNSDVVHRDLETPYGRCPTTVLRAAAWGSLVLLFGEKPGMPSEMVLFAWSYGFDPERGEGGVDTRNLNLTTPEGAGLGTTRSDLRDLYGMRLEEMEDTSIEVWSFAIGLPADRWIRGLLDGPGDDAPVVLIESAPGCA